MRAQFRARRPLRAERQRGQAMLLSVLLLVVGISGLVYTLATPATSASQSDKRTDTALAQAKEALIGRAAADQSIPGSLPCPDTGNDGSAELFVGNHCPSYIGRLPWRTLGLPDLRDGSGERLWYVLSPNFRDDDSVSPLNSDTIGQLTITGLSPAAKVIAIIFAPGGVIEPQRRDTIAQQGTASNYLDGENGNGDALYTTGLAIATFNDKLLPITSDALFNVVNVRVAKEARKAVSNYRAANGYYPRANPYGDPSFNCDDSTYSGRLPINVQTCTQQLLVTPIPFQPWAGHLPGWFETNRWNTVTHYAVSLGCTVIVDLILTNSMVQGFCDTLGFDNGLLGSGGTPLTVNGTGGAPVSASVVLFVSGQAMGGQAPPQAPRPPSCTAANQCLETPNSGASPFTKPARFPGSNDRMAAICASTTPCDPVP